MRNLIRAELLKLPSEAPPTLTLSPHSPLGNNFHSRRQIFHKKLKLSTRIVGTQSVLYVRHEKLFSFTANRETRLFHSFSTLPSTKLKQSGMMSSGRLTALLTINIAINFYHLFSCLIMSAVSPRLISYHDAFFIETQDEENVEEETAVDSAENETAEQSECFINLTNQLALGCGRWTLG